MQASPSHIKSVFNRIITAWDWVYNDDSSVNVPALLMEYENNHFVGFDPLDEYALEW